jgi:hypothetical protein
VPVSFRSIGRRVALAFVMTSLIHVAGAAAQASGEERAVLATVERWVATMRTRDTATMRQLSHPGLKLFGMRPRAGVADSVVQVLTIDQFLAFIANDKRTDWHERLWQPEVRVAGSLATVFAGYDFHFGQTFSHCGYDAFQLLRTPEGWRVVGLADTYQVAGCPQRPPPGR